MSKMQIASELPMSPMYHVRSPPHINNVGNHLGNFQAYSPLGAEAAASREKAGRRWQIMMFSLGAVLGLAVVVLLFLLMSR